MKRYYSLSAHLRQRFGGRVQKIPLDAGFSCPNRDGALSTRACVFCNSAGSGSGLADHGNALSEQWNLWRVRFLQKYKTDRFIAYLQSFSNTYGPIAKLRRVLEDIAPLPGLVGLAVGARPDCLDSDKLELLAAQALPEIWLELGLQSSNDETLARINRGHDAACFARAAHQAAERGLKVCAHVIAGLPGESAGDFHATIDFLNDLPIHGVKLHNLYVCENSELADIWRQGEYDPLAEAEYVAMAVEALRRLRPEVVVQRLNGDAKPGELLAPAWAADKQRVLGLIEQRLEALDLWQGKAFAPDAVPAWFDPAASPPEYTTMTPE